MSVENELKLCPFCLCKPYYSVSVNGTHLITVGCSTCGINMKTCNLGTIEDPKPSDDIVKSWNTRQQPPRIEMDEDKNV